MLSIFFFKRYIVFILFFYFAFPLKCKYINFLLNHKGKLIGSALGIFILARELWLIKKISDVISSSILYTIEEKLKIFNNVKNRTIFGVFKKEFLEKEIKEEKDKIVSCKSKIQQSGVGLNINIISKMSAGHSDENKIVDNNIIGNKANQQKNDSLDSSNVESSLIIQSQCNSNQNLNMNENTINNFGEIQLKPNIEEQKGLKIEYFKLKNNLYGFSGSCVSALKEHSEFSTVFRI
jgi:hypothetical protein